MSDQKAESKNIVEQIKNKNDQKPDFYTDLKLFVEKDEFGLFKTNEIRKVTKNISLSQKEIEKLLELKVKATKMASQLLEQKKVLKQKVLKTKTELLKELEIQ